MSDIVFIFREITLNNFSSDFARIDEEIVFLQYEQAKKFAMGKFRDQASESSLDFYRYEILQIEIGCEDGFYTKEIFSIDGVLLTNEVYNQSGCESFHSRAPDPVPAIAGELVFLFKNLECGKSSFVTNQVAVILYCFNENGVEDLTIGYIDEAGYFSHQHGANFLIKAISDSSVSGKKEMALRAAYRAWHDPAGCSDDLRHFVNGKLPFFDL